ncbi:hypothetical protein ASZ90_006945 [hydrocarbon metagenome]|uniref:Uncharacterized protein n=1 Tax=hydrocarbon metagenome TaxID=938273 RepID=A0A0W8FR94_9ZZZZ
MKCVENQVQPDTVADMTGMVVWKIVKTPAARKLVMSIVHAALKDWSGDSKLKMRMSANVEKIFDEVLSSKEKTENKIAGDLDYAEILRPGFRKIIENIDFGELKETLDCSQDDIAAVVKMANEEMWQYPAKVVCLLSMLPSVANMTVSAVKETLTPINNLAPDLLGDVVLSLADEIDGKNIGLVINELCELVRKVHTGSVLLGEPGKPQSANTLSHLMQDTMSTININLLLKARASLSEIKEMSLQNLIDLLEQSPELSREFFQSHFVSLIASIRKWSRKADAFERLFSDEDIAREFARGMSEIDAQEIAGTISRLCGMLNRVRATTPGIIRNTLSQMINSVDAVEVGETVQWFTEDVVESLKPVATEVLPPLIRGLADLLRPNSSGIPSEIADALEYLKNAINSKEAAV